MLNKVKVPSLVWSSKRYGLVITDDRVYVYVWKRGALELLGQYSNNESGQGRFTAWVAEHKEVHGKDFAVAVNIIGEDHRHEKVAHLYGKYKTDFIKRRFNQLFRGSDYCYSETQGREELGKREDLMLFYGILSPEKITPWLAVVSSVAKGHLSGLYSASIVSDVLRDALGLAGKTSIIMTMFEDNAVRQTFYLQGKLRFSRLSKCPAGGSIDVFVATLEKEIERMLQYLASLRISLGGQIEISLVCPTQLVASLTDGFARVQSDRYKFKLYDASNVANKIGLKSSTGVIGVDSSLLLHSVMAYFRFGIVVPFNTQVQLLNFARLRSYWIFMLSRVAVVGFAVYLLIGGLNVGSKFASTYSTIAIENNEKLENLELQRSAYAIERRTFGDPPSSAQNMRSVSQVFSVLDRLDFSPSIFLNYISDILEVSPGVELNEIEWNVTDDISGDAGNILPSDSAFLSGKDIYQVVLLTGSFVIIEGESLAQLAARARQFSDLLAQRSDMAVRVISLPDESQRELDRGVLNQEVKVDDIRTRDFALEVYWKQVSAETLEELLQVNISQ